MFEYYCKKNGIDFKKELSFFISWLLKTKKKFIVVFDDKTELSPANKHFSFENKLRSKFNHFQNIGNIVAIIVSKSDFIDEYLTKEFDRIDFPSYTTVDYLKYLNELN